MKITFSKLTFTATLALAIAFTLSCSSGGDSNGNVDDDGGDIQQQPSSSSGGGYSSGGIGNSSSSTGGNTGGGNSSDANILTYAGQTYRTVQIGTQTWMAENLNYAAEGSRCYGEGAQVHVRLDNEILMLSLAEVQANCSKYGRLYDWATAMALPASCNESECASQVQLKHRGVCPDGWHIPSDADWTTLTNYVESQGDCSECAGTKLKAASGWENYLRGSGSGLDTYGFTALPGGNGYWSGFSNAGYDGLWWSSAECSSDGAYSRYMAYYSEYAYWYCYDKTALYSVRCVKD